jgi:hypothetical protein
MEKYLAIDYMMDGISGAMIDYKVLEKLLKYNKTEIFEKLKKIKLQ